MGTWIGYTQPVETFTGVFQKGTNGWIAWADEIPGANTQGGTLEEARTNLREAVRMVIDANREIAEKMLGGNQVIREKIAI